ncbi:MAG: hypothetical protein KDE31_29835, partial [Caldilineaceae bacterium]|nr:hypothetical protein [Caldilineaceae bacterium]
EWVAESNERIAETRAEGLARIAKLESDYARDRERAAGDHRDRLLSAAARLDAVAVREEQRRYATQQQEAEDAFNERVASERQSIAERIEQEREGHEERLREARQADQERIADMREAQAEQQRLEDEDRAIRLQRQAEDHQRQLDEQARANAERLAQISTQAAQERAALDEDFLQQLASLNLYNQHWLDLQKAKEKESLLSFERWWDAVNEQINATIQGPITEAEAWPTRFIVPGGGAAGAAPLANFGSGTTNRSVNIAEGAIVVNAAPGQNEAQVARLVREEMISLLEAVN